MPTIKTITKDLKTVISLSFFLLGFSFLLTPSKIHAAEVYGNPLNADSYASDDAACGLWNINLDGTEVSFRIRAKHTGTVNAIREYFVHSESGYSSGDGGDIRVQIRADDGTSNHRPSSTVLASAINYDPQCWAISH